MEPQPEQERKGKERTKVGKQKWFTCERGKGDSSVWDSKTLPSGSCQPSFIDASFSSLCLLLAHSAFLAPPSKYNKSITLLQLQLLLFNTHLWRDICRYLLINRKLINTTCYSLQNVAWGWNPPLAATQLHFFSSVWMLLVANRRRNAPIWLCLCALICEGVHLHVCFYVWELVL